MTTLEEKNRGIFEKTPDEPWRRFVDAMAGTVEKHGGSVSINYADRSLAMVLNGKTKHLSGLDCYRCIDVFNEVILFLKENSKPLWH